jgi:GNAT superfamily N-acetyltransferase
LVVVQVPGPTLTIREREPDELAIEVEISNASFPPDWHSSVDEVEGWESLRQPEDIALRLLAFLDGEPVGVGKCDFREHFIPGRFEVEVIVRPQVRRLGIGGALNAQVTSFARLHGARALECGVRATQLEPILPWLTREGYREVSRMRESELALTSLGADLDEQAANLARSAGISLVTLAEEDTPDNRTKLWKLSVLTEKDIPFDEPHPEEPFEQFERILNSPLVLKDNLVIAKDGDDYVGLSLLGRQTAQKAFTWTTGVHPSYRGRGVAKAIKYRSAALARQHGFAVMRTFNHVNNPAMLAVNVGMGYVPLPEVVSFVRDLG